MPFPDLLTRSEKRLAGLLFFLALVGIGVREGGRLSPAVEIWLAGGEEARSEPGGFTVPPPGAGTPAGPVPTPPVSGAIGPGPGPDSQGPAPPPSSGGVDPNTANLERLLTLPGVGPVLASRILEDRARNGPYRRSEDLLRVKGVGPATLARIRPLLGLP